MAEQIIFIITAAIALTGGIAMLLSRNAVHSALFLLINFGAVAVLYLLLQAPFLFAVQLIIYAGAIIVLFLFVVMLLGAERAEDASDQLSWQRPLAIGLAIALLAEGLFVTFGRNLLPNSTTPTAAADFGNPVQIAESLFTTYLLPFEITSLILLAAIVGVIVLNQREKA